MGIFEFILLAALLGALAWLVTKFVPMPDQVKKVIVIAVVFLNDANKYPDRFVVRYVPVR